MHQNKYNKAHIKYIINIDGGCSFSYSIRERIVKGRTLYGKKNQQCHHTVHDSEMILANMGTKSGAHTSNLEKECERELHTGGRGHDTKGADY